jgi:hypothetical protein
MRSSERWPGGPWSSSSKRADAVLCLRRAREARHLGGQTDAVRQRSACSPCCDTKAQTTVPVERDARCASAPVSDGDVNARPKKSVW